MEWLSLELGLFWVWVWVRIWVWVVRCPGAVLCVIACLAAFLADRMPVAAGSNPPCLPQSKLSSGDKIALLRTAALKDSFVLGKELQIYPENCSVSPCHAPLYGSWGKNWQSFCVCVLPVSDMVPMRHPTNTWGTEPLLPTQSFGHSPPFQVHYSNEFYLSTIHNENCIEPFVR